MEKREIKDKKFNELDFNFGKMQIENCIYD